MIYMVEMDFRHPEREAEWHAWYMAHIGVLLSVPGFRASQRFQAVADGTPSPYLALHEVASADMFDSAAYRSRGGPASTGEWQQLQSDWHRNLLEGLEQTPDVPDDAYVLLLRDARDVGLPEPVEADAANAVSRWCATRCRSCRSRSATAASASTARSAARSAPPPGSSSSAPFAGEEQAEGQRVTSGHLDWDSGPKTWLPGIVVTSRR